ncbi:MAG: MoaD/ThiS family protein [Oscillospiraceae bacterium]|nr:MoaD/ThiS family protein [Oscillospiraceae bacterium]
MIEVRLFATLRDGRGKILEMSPDSVSTASDILSALSIPAADVAILLINGFHSKPEDPVSDGDVVALFPPVGGG